MSRHRFIIPDLSLSDTAVRLTGALLQHARARRLRTGEAIELGDGRGLLRAGTVVRLSPSLVDVEVAAGAIPTRDSFLDLTLAVAWLKSSSLDEVVEKVSELGVRNLWLFQADHSVAVGSAKRLDRLRRIAQASAEQCGRASVLEIEDHGSLAGVLIEKPSRLGILFSEPVDDTPVLRPWPDNAGTAPASILAVLGPEGGFSPAERAAAGDSGFYSLTVGPRVIRATTAVVVAAILCQMWWGDFPPGPRRPTW